MTPRPRRALVRPHVVTGGRAHPTRNVFDLVTLVVAGSGGGPTAGLNPEQRRLLDLCRGGPLSVAEIAGHLDLPTSVTKVLLSDLVDGGHLSVRAPAAPSQLPSVPLLQEVLDGLRARL
ncbi:DUF742 domain-containing protein [Actinomadura craniellae]|uniref:DUF742 domain-containing protein n=1 Tax=Actinomadura craniellae TaxID=2231787 RepID=A0A365H9E1_9ACTN|nr:DUF742 domain-containing protein [Actinomadura craniellae]RAY15715.1 DUF742 domain-containing protein [Actinomadura craniellae]